jgi:hypothetical protein
MSDAKAAGQSAPFFAGGDKPRPYRTGRAGSLRAGFAPARVGFHNLRIAQIRFSSGGAFPSPPFFHSILDNFR